MLIFALFGVHFYNGFQRQVSRMRFTLYFQHLDEISDENMMKKQIGPYSKSEKKRKNTLQNAPKTPRNDSYYILYMNHTAYII